MNKNNITTKICKRCNYEKNVKEFSSNVTTHDGYYTYCKPCNSETTKERLQRRKENTPMFFDVNAEPFLI
jgi:superfamily II helicase